MGEDERDEVLNNINEAINSDDDDEMLRGYLDARSFWRNEARYMREDERISWHAAFDTRGRPEITESNLTITPDNISISTINREAMITNSDDYSDSLQSLYERMLPVERKDLIDDFNKKCENCNKEECVVINCFIDHLFSNFTVRRK